MAEFPDLENMVQRVRERSHKASRFADRAFLAEAGMLETVRQVSTRSGWPGMVDTTSFSDVEAVSQILGSCKYIEHTENPYLLVMFEGARLEFHLDHIRSIFGWPLGRGCRMDELDQGVLPGFWKELISDDNAIFEPSDAPATHIRDPVYFFIQKVTSGTIMARDSGKDKVTHPELFMLMCFYRGWVPDFAHYLCLHWESIKKKPGPIVCGGMVTLMLRRMQLIGDEPMPDRRVIQPEYLTRSQFMKMRAIEVNLPMRRVAWKYHRNPDFRQSIRTQPPQPQPQQQPRSQPSPVRYPGESSQYQQPMAGSSSQVPSFLQQFDGRMGNMEMSLQQIIEEQRQIRAVLQRHFHEDEQPPQ